MFFSQGGRGWPRRISLASASLLAFSLVLGTAGAARSGTAAPPVICYAVITLENESDLGRLADRYHTTVKEIRRDNPNLALGSTLTIRENTVPTTVSKASRGSVSAWVLPIKGSVSSAYGWRDGDFHHGLDFAVPSGTLVRSARSGRVEKAGWLGVYGLAVLVDHGNGVQSLYAHNSRLLVKVGQLVQTGQEITYSGNTGRTTGPHLHFEIRLKGRALDPSEFFDKVQLVEAGTEVLLEG